jgi:hypothetical protein
MDTKTGISGKDNGQILKQTTSVALNPRATTPPRNEGWRYCLSWTKSVCALHALSFAQTR